MIVDLPKTVEINNKSYDIRWDYRAILDIIEAMQECNDNEKSYAALFIFYPDFERIPEKDYPEAVKQLEWFLACGQKEEPQNSLILLSWTQDFPYIVSAINRVAGCEIRNIDNIHWWTFYSYFMEIGECTLATIVSIRKKLKQHKKLDKLERQWYRENKHIVDIQKVKTAEDEEFEHMLLGR